MPNAIMDPENVRRFAEELNRFNTDTLARLGSLQARFASLGDTWKDKEHEKFAEEFQQVIKTFRRFIDISQQQAPFLMRKAQHIEDYLKQR